jgi:GTP-binding protein HflX
VLNSKPFDTNKVQETCVLVGVITRQQSQEQSNEYLEELAFLASTAGAKTIKRFTQKLDYADPRTFIGSGKLNEIIDFVHEENIDIVIFDDELSPTQLRNIEKAFEREIKILDRAHLILDIFASRAQTAQSRTQVELAQNQYLLPRLTRMWTHLSKQKGGIGMKGPGEKEIETDRRGIRNRIALLKEKLKEIDKQMETQRKTRNKQIRVALVGYTNVGKSTIMNLMAKSDVFAENKLFATLDTTVRKVVIDRVPFLLSDTVGFIRKLPHHLVESFKSTLDEVREADILLHVVDLSHPNFEEQISVVRETLQSIKAFDKKEILVFNKIDQVTDLGDEELPDYDVVNFADERPTLQSLKKTWMSKGGDVIFISAVDKVNLNGLRSIIVDAVHKSWEVKYPYTPFEF